MQKKPIKIDEDAGFIMTILRWVGNTLNKTEIFFTNFEEAKNHCEHEKGKIKIYDHRRRIVHSEERGHDDDSYC